MCEGNIFLTQLKYMQRSNKKKKKYDFYREFILGSSFFFLKIKSILSKLTSTHKIKGWGHNTMAERISTESL